MEFGNAVIMGLMTGGAPALKCLLEGLTNQTNTSYCLHSQAYGVTVKDVCYIHTLTMPRTESEDTKREIYARRAE